MTNLQLPALASSTPLDSSISNASTPTLNNSRTRRNIIIAAVLIFAIAVGLRVIANARHSAELAASTNAALERTVMITYPKPGALKQTLVLPTTLRGISEAAIFARNSGYVVSIKKDIGDSVKQGDVLATLAAPEQDEELARAQANYAQMFEHTGFAQMTADRYESLRRKDGISQQELEEKRSDLRQAQANLAAAKAEVNRLEQLRALRSITAPFAGVLTRRAINVGDLVSVGNTELFAIAQNNPLKLTIWVPQANASNVKIGQAVPIALNEFDNETFTANVDRVAGGIDTQTRSRQVDLLLPNANGKLLPGAYAEAHLELAQERRALIAPSSVLKTTSDGFQVAVVDRNNHVAFRDIKIGRDLGREIEVLDGINPDDTLVVSPSDLLVDGEAVKTTAWEPLKKDKEKKDKASDTGSDKKTLTKL